MTINHTPNCPGGNCDDTATTFLCDACGREYAACCGVSESETCDDCEGKMELARLTDEDGRVITCDKIDGVTWVGVPYGMRATDALALIDIANLNTTANALRADNASLDAQLIQSAIDITALRVELAEARATISEVSALVNGTIREREAVKLKLEERELDLVRAGKLWDETQRKLDDALKTIEALRQRDTVRPEALGDAPHCASCECTRLE